MKRRWLQIRRGHRLLLYAISLTLFLSGIGWTWIQHLDEAGNAGNPLLRMKTTLIAVHGLGAMAFVLLLGTLLVSHVRRAWHARKNRKNGAFVLAAVSLLTLSGYALYYTGNEDARNAVSSFHLWLGAAAPALLLWHTWSGRNAVNRD